jgi:hypothetical protein
MTTGWDDERLLTTGGGDGDQDRPALRRSRMRPGWIRRPRLQHALAAAALTLLLPSAAAGAPKAGASSVSLRLVESCVFEADYAWSGFGSAGTSATGALTMYLREPGEDDLVVTFSSYSFPSAYTLKSGSFSYRFGDQRGFFVSVGLSADARIVMVGQLVYEKRHYGTLILDAARAESTPIPIPAACLS